MRDELRFSELHDPTLPQAARQDAALRVQALPRNVRPADGPDQAHRLETPKSDGVQTESEKRGCSLLFVLLFKYHFKDRETK